MGAGGPFASPVDAALARRIEAFYGGGEPVPGSDRAALERAFGRRTVSEVPFHRGAGVDELCAALGARAFSVDGHVFVGGSYRPGTPGGRHLLAHELAHVLQGERRTIRRVVKGADGAVLSPEEIRALLARRFADEGLTVADLVRSRSLMDGTARQLAEASAEYSLDSVHGLIAQQVRENAVDSRRDRLRKKLIQEFRSEGVYLSMIEDALGKEAFDAFVARHVNGPLNERAAVREMAGLYDVHRGKSARRDGEPGEDHLGIPGLRSSGLAVAVDCAGEVKVDDTASEVRRSCSPHVRFHLDFTARMEGNETSGWQLGFTQTVLADRRTLTLSDGGHGRKEITFSLDGPRSDNVCAPWYDRSSYVNLGPTTAKGCTVTLDDAPGLNYAFRPDDPYWSVHHLAGTSTFKTWLLLHNSLTGENRFLRAWKWEVAYTTSGGAYRLLEETHLDPGTDCVLDGETANASLRRKVSVTQPSAWSEDSSDTEEPSAEDSQGEGDGVFYAVDAWGGHLETCLVRASGAARGSWDSYALLDLASGEEARDCTVLSPSGVPIGTSNGIPLSCGAEAWISTLPELPSEAVDRTALTARLDDMSYSCIPFSADLPPTECVGVDGWWRVAGTDEPRALCLIGEEH
ncbi:DUF4157 domain-containing protein [Streptomyces sp. NPDC059918]|uniref:eCIS core domain-containing protein n=1 Tax=unclassified Streptomyces TaxID=2593676 RepID=UPI0036499946